MPAADLVAETFPFLDRNDIETFLGICFKNDRLYYFPDDREIFGYYRFYPELIEAVAAQDYDLLEQCDLTEGPIIYIAVLILAGDGFKTMWQIASKLSARAVSYHRFNKHGDWRFHFVRNNRFGRAHALLN